MTALRIIALAALMATACAGRQKSAGPPPPEPPTAEWVRDDKVIPLLNPAQANPLAYSTLVQEDFNRVARKVQKCYKRELKDRPRLHGELVIGLAVPPSGVVEKAWVDFSTVPSLRMEGCILPLFDGLQLPSPGESGVELLHPYVFTSKKTPPEIAQALSRLHRLEDPDQRDSSYGSSQDTENYEAPW